MRAKVYFSQTFTRTELEKYRLELLIAENRRPEAEKLFDEMLTYALAQRSPDHSYTRKLLKMCP